MATSTISVSFLPHVEGSDDYSTVSYSNLYTLFPGSNSVPADIWGQIKTHPQMIRRIEAGSLRELDLSDEGDRLTWVRGLWNLPLLRAMAQSETSPLVQQLIANQIKSLVAANCPEEFSETVYSISLQAFFSKCGPRILRANFNLPDQLLRQHFTFLHPQNVPA